MKSSKLPVINSCNYCKYPDGIDNIKDFVDFMNKNYHSFVELEFLSEDGCVAPFFIDEELKIKTEYVTPANLHRIEEEKVYFLSRSEYEEKLKKVIAEKCVHCIHYSENLCTNDYTSHIENIDLNGECYGFETKD